MKNYNWHIIDRNDKTLSHKFIMIDYCKKLRCHCIELITAINNVFDDLEYAMNTQQNKNVKELRYQTVKLINKHVEMYEWCINISYDYPRLALLTIKGIDNDFIKDWSFDWMPDYIESMILKGN